MRSKAIVFIVLGVGAAVFILRDFIFHGNNMNERKEYWEREIAASLKPGSPKEELEAFASKNGLVLDCYQSYGGGDRCDFQDQESTGGTSSHPMKLLAVFTLQDGVIAAHELTVAPANTLQ